MIDGTKREDVSTTVNHAKGTTRTPYRRTEQLQADVGGNFSQGVGDLYVAVWIRRRSR